MQASTVDKEIIVIDDKSTDGTRFLLEDLDNAPSEGKCESIVSPQREAR
jgi:glycosyltransferase involved in cell wall biosynthesis